LFSVRQKRKGGGVKAGNNANIIKDRGKGKKKTSVRKGKAKLKNGLKEKRK